MQPDGCAIAPVRMKKCQDSPPERHLGTSGISYPSVNLKIPMKIKKTNISLFALLALSAGMTHAAVLVSDFEGFEPGNIADQGWPGSVGGGFGHVVTTTSSGAYAGGQGLRGANSANNGNGTYLNAVAPVGNVPNISQIQFDLYWNSSISTSEQVGIGRWYDLDDNGIYSGPHGGGGQHPEAGILGGLVNDSGSKFGFRDASLLGGQGTGTGNSSGVAPANDTWYQITITFDDDNFIATLDVYDLMNEQVVDLDPLGEGTSFSKTFTESTYFPYGNSGDAAGVVLRVSGGYIVDNIYVIPEPGPLLLAFGALGILGARRRR